jgi:hypothetical protein
VFVDAGDTIYISIGGSGDAASGTYTLAFSQGPPSCLSPRSHRIAAHVNC